MYTDLRINSGKGISAHLMLQNGLVESVKVACIVDLDAAPQLMFTMTTPLDTDSNDGRSANAIPFRLETTLVATWHPALSGKRAIRISQLLPPDAHQTNLPEGIVAISNSLAWFCTWIEHDEV